jgi:hypothetical protein
LDNPTVEPPRDAAAAAAVLQVALGQIEFARAYTLELLEATPRELWFEQPDACRSCVAWQVGHLAVSQYGLLMFRQRGRRPEDLDLIPGRFRKQYGRGGTPPTEATGQPDAEALLERLSKVHAAALDELREADPQRLLEPVEMPYAVYPIKLGAVLFCPLHEQLHAGQIGILRRALGLDSIR